MRGSWVLLMGTAEEACEMVTKSKICPKDFLVSLLVLPCLSHFLNSFLYFLSWNQLMSLSKRLPKPRKHPLTNDFGKRKKETKITNTFLRIPFGFRAESPFFGAWNSANLNQHNWDNPKHWSWVTRSHAFWFWVPSSFLFLKSRLNFKQSC